MSLGYALEITSLVHGESTLLTSSSKLLTTFWNPGVLARRIYHPLQLRSRNIRFEEAYLVQVNSPTKYLMLRMLPACPKNLLHIYKHDLRRSKAAKATAFLQAPSSISWRFSLRVFRMLSSSLISNCIFRIRVSVDSLSVSSR